MKTTGPCDFITLNIKTEARDDVLLILDKYDKNLFKLLVLLVIADNRTICINEEKSTVKQWAWKKKLSCYWALKKCKSVVFGIYWVLYKKSHIFSIDM